MRTKFLAGLVLVLCAAALTFAADGSWTGYISDSMCASYVFVNDADKKVYAIDAQDKVAAHAGHHVTVKGSVEGDNLKLTSIEMAK